MGSHLKRLKKARGSRLFHYTIGAYLPAIVASGELLTTDTALTGVELSAVWFSFDPEWEETANKSLRSRAGEHIIGTRASTMAWGNGLARIEVQPSAAPHTWQQHQRVSGISSQMAQALERVARAEAANPQDWRVSYEAVPADRWLAIEINRGNGWETWKHD